MTKMGRPELPDHQRRRNVRSVHFTDAELADVEAAAERAGMKLTAWIRSKAVAAAKRSR